MHRLWTSHAFALPASIAALEIDPCTRAAGYIVKPEDGILRHATDDRRTIARDARTNVIVRTNGSSKSNRLIADLSNQAR